MDRQTIKTEQCSEQMDRLGKIESYIDRQTCAGSEVDWTNKNWRTVSQPASQSVTETSTKDSKLITEERHETRTNT